MDSVDCALVVSSTRAHLSKKKTQSSQTQQVQGCLELCKQNQAMFGLCRIESQQICTGVKLRIMRLPLLILLLRLPLPCYPKGHRSIIEWNLEIK